MLLSGILIDPSTLNLISSELLEIAPDLRQFALLVILFTAPIGALGIELTYRQLLQRGD